MSETEPKSRKKCLPVEIGSSPLAARRGKNFSMSKASDDALAFEKVLFLSSFSIAMLFVDGDENSLA